MITFAETRGISAVGSAQHWQCWGQEFESPYLHLIIQMNYHQYLENYTLNLKLKYLISKNKFNFTDKRESIFCL